ncbi:MAG TPA: hypothetical protein VK483_03900 [Chitinophagaceae bacterium]|nr:hypothetical protein [Chitinophagaceae bacterium]
MKERIGTFLLAIILYVSAAAQKIDSALNVMATQYPAEKIYIHYDKDYYVAGETIWFKAYLYSDGKPSGMSTNLYLQFTDNKGRVIFNQKYPALGAVAKGNIDIPDSLPQGNYYIRALTAGMLNYDETYIYKKNIFVFKGSTTSTSANPEAQNISLQFFPESGNMVDGILTVVGFKANDQWGTPVDVNGVIRTEDGITIASFKSYHDGIGKIQFKPQAGKKYIADVETVSGPRTYSLPVVQSSGISLKIQDEKGGKKFQLSRSEKDKAQLNNLLMVAEINNHIVYENEITFDEYPSVIGHLVTDSLPSGILHFTVFNADGIPLAERLSFVDNGEYRGAADIGITKANSEKRAENTFEINFPGAIQRSCSVSVIDLPAAGLNDNDNIWSRFLLTSDLKGYIHDPSWYFVRKDSPGENQNDTTKQALDNLLLTHGWSRFNWTKILNRQFPEKKYSDPGLVSVSGIVKDERTKEILPAGKLNILLEAEDSTSQTYEVEVNAQGRFKMDSLLFIGKASLFYTYTGNNGKQRSALVFVDEDPMSKIISLVPQDITKNNIERKAAALQNKKEIDTRYQYIKSRLEEEKELERVTIQAKVNKKPFDVVNEKYTTGVFRSPGKVNLDNINEPANDKSQNVVDYIKNNVQQIEIQGGQFVNRKNISLMTGQKWAVGVFINGAPANILELRILRVDQVALIKFYEAGFVGSGSSTPGGAIAVYTKELFKEDEKPDKLNYFEYQGFSITKEFYKPDYNAADAKRMTPDNRTTLYWNPDVYTDTETRSVKLNFFNNDFSKKYKIILEGFDAAGKLIHLEKIVGN